LYLVIIQSFGGSALGHSKPESTGRCLGSEVDDALESAEQTEI
jgi:hypothetical protein